MKVLTLRQPWANLVIDGYKCYEFRSWKTNYRGKLLIHAGMGFDNLFRDKFSVYDLTYIKGAIIGEVEVVDCILVDEQFENKLKDINSLVYGSDNYIGKYAWVLENVVKYDEPIYVKGKLGLWNYDN